MDLLWRPLTLDDAPAMAELVAITEKVEPTGEHYDAADLRELMSSPNVDLTGASTSGWDGERLVASGIVIRRGSADPAHMVRFEALTHPDYRDDALGEHLMAWFAESAKRVHEKAFPGAPLELHAAAHEDQRWFAGTLERAGFRHLRSFVDMRADLASLPPARPLPPGFEPVPYTGRYDELTRLARNAVFADHWGSAEQSPEMWRHQVSESKDFRPELSFLLLSPAGDEVLAFVLSAYFASDEAATGVRELYVSDVGTRESLRGRGIASALLGYTLEKAKEQGFERSALNVDVDNAQGALGVYERCGYRTVQTWAGYVLPVT
ncbi:GNAT family N-acetyltransferase [Amycolatopsis sp. NPDC058986]|uniref:GNAT family N-acetyltransferase n=1 Tax=unclassified Amycolatopsis TaxID=2618356 RepID=UPI00366E4348